MRNEEGACETRHFGSFSFSVSSVFSFTVQGAHGVVFATKEVGVIVVREAAAGIANLAQFGLKYQNQVVRAQGLKLLVNLLATTSDDETKYHTVSRSSLNGSSGQKSSAEHCWVDDSRQRSFRRHEPGSGVD